MPADRLQVVNDDYLAAIGADPRELGITYDILPRPGRPPVPVAFTLGMGAWAADQPPAGPWTPRPPWVFATYAEGGLGNLLELLHESGHALHMAAIRTRPAFLDFPEASAAFLEGTADVLGWDVDEPAWQRRWLGEAAEPREALLEPVRRGHARHLLGALRDRAPPPPGAPPERRLDRDRPPTASASSRIPSGRGGRSAASSSTGPGYLANYALSAIMAAAVRARIVEVRGPWFEGDPGWYGFVAEALFAAGASRPPADLLEAFLGGPLTAEPLLADLRRGG